MKKIISTIILVLGIQNISLAQLTKTNTKATASLTPSCTLITSNVSFGEIDSSVWNFTKGNIDIVCTRQTAYSVRGMAQETDDWYHYMNHTNPSVTDHLIFLINTVSNSDPSSWLLNNMGINSIGTGDLQRFPLYFRTIGQKMKKQDSSQVGLRVTPGNYSSNYNITLTY